MIAPQSLHLLEDVLTAHTLRYLCAALGLGSLFLACSRPADAESPIGRSWRAPAPYSFSVEDEAGNALPTFVKEGRTFLLAEAGLRYNIRVQNPTALRVEAVLSVDGRDAVSGEPGDYVNQRGYVIPAYGSLLVEGFRRSLQEVAAFRFTSPEDSYSARRGTPENVGVIGVAFFPEQRHAAAPVVRRPVSRAPTPSDDYFSDARGGGERASDHAAAPPSAPMKRSAAPSAAAAPSEGQRDSLRGRRDGQGSLNEPGAGSSVNNLGTQFAETRESVVSNVPFARASSNHPALLLRLRYDDAQGLLARGIDLSGEYNAGRFGDEPEPFPVTRFAQPPP
jgi:hypothetical protein